MSRPSLTSDMAYSRVKREKAEVPHFTDANRAITKSEWYYIYHSKRDVGVMMSEQKDGTYKIYSYLLNESGKPNRNDYVYLAKNEDIAYDVQDEIDAIERGHYNGNKTREDVYYKTNQLLDKLFRYGRIYGYDYNSDTFVENKQGQERNNEVNRGEVNPIQRESTGDVKLSKDIQLGNSLDDVLSDKDIAQKLGLLEGYEGIGATAGNLDVARGMQTREQVLKENIENFKDNLEDEFEAQTEENGYLPEDLDYNTIKSLIEPEYDNPYTDPGAYDLTQEEWERVLESATQYIANKYGIENKPYVLHNKDIQLDNQGNVIPPKEAERLKNLIGDRVDPYNSNSKHIN